MWRVCNATIVVGSAAVALNMPPPRVASITVAADSAGDHGGGSSGGDSDDNDDGLGVSVLTLARATDGAALAPLNTPSMASLRLAVTFADGTTQDFSTDERAVVEVVQGAHLVALGGGGGGGESGGSDDGVDSATARSPWQLFVNSSLAQGERGTATLRLTFPSLYPGLNATLKVLVVELQKIQLAVRPYPFIEGASTAYNLSSSSSSSSSSLASVELLMVSCSEVWQRLEVRASAHLSDGTVADASAFYSSSPSGLVLTSSNPLVASFNGNQPCVCADVSSSSGSGGDGSGSSIGSNASASCSCRGLAPQRAGNTTVTASFGGVTSAPLLVKALPSSAYVVGLEVELLGVAGATGSSGSSSGSSGGGGGASTPTFSAVAGSSSSSFRVTATFHDGSLLVVGPGTESASWLNASSFLAFNSSAPHAIAALPSGVVTLLGNYHDRVVLSVRDACPAYSSSLHGGDGNTAVAALAMRTNTTTSADVTVWANLKPALYDVDLGAESGGQPFFFISSSSSSSGNDGDGNSTEQLTVGATLSVDVRVQASSVYDLTAFQLIVTFDAALLRVESDASCVKGNGWGGSSFECTTNDPVDEVLLIGSCGLVPTSGCASKGLVHVATVTFTASAPGRSFVAGEIIKLKDAATTVVSVGMVAGVGEIVVAGDTGRRRQLLPSQDEQEKNRDHGLHSRHSRRRHRRFLSDAQVVECNDLLGDANGDCLFDVEDVQHLQYFIGGALNESSLTSQQLQAMDPDLDGDSDAVDISYLSKVLAGKYRFLSAFSFVETPFSLVASVKDSASLPAHSASTSVAFEIGTLLNKDPSSFLLSAPNHHHHNNNNETILDEAFAETNSWNLTQDGVVVEGVEVDNSSLALGHPSSRHFLSAKQQVNSGAGGSGGAFQVGPAENVPHSESGVGVVVLVSTRDANGLTSAARQFAFYCTRLVQACVAVYGDDAAAFKPFAFVNIGQQTHIPTPRPTSWPSLAPSSTPSFPPTPSPSTFDTVKINARLVLSGADAAALVTESPEVLAQIIAKAGNISSAMVRNVRLAPFPSPSPTQLPTSEPSHFPTDLPTLAPSISPLQTPLPTTTQQGRRSRRKLGKDEKGEDDVDEGSSSSSSLTSSSSSLTSTSTATSGGGDGRLLAEEEIRVVVLFELVTDLVQAGHSTAKAFLEDIAASLETTVQDGTLEAALVEACGGCQVTTLAVTLASTKPYPTLHPTPLPSEVPSPSPTVGMCSYRYLPCEHSLYGDNTQASGHAGSFVGNPSGDVNFVTSVVRPTRLVFSTCSSSSNSSSGSSSGGGGIDRANKLNSSLLLFNGCPGEVAARPIGSSETRFNVSERVREHVDRS
jgi:hypothetical protein